MNLSRRTFLSELVKLFIKLVNISLWAFLEWRLCDSANLEQTSHSGAITIRKLIVWPRGGENYSKVEALSFVTITNCSQFCLRAFRRGETFFFIVSSSWPIKAAISIFRELEGEQQGNSKETLKKAVVIAWSLFANHARHAIWNVRHVSENAWM